MFCINDHILSTKKNRAPAILHVDPQTVIFHILLLGLALLMLVQSWSRLWTLGFGLPCWSGCTHSRRWLCSPEANCRFVSISTTEVRNESYRCSFAISDSFLALGLSQQGFISVDFERTSLHLRSLMILRCFCSYLIFVIFSPRAQFLAQIFSTQNSVNQKRNWFCNKTV